MNFKPSTTLLAALLTLGGCASGSSGPLQIPANAIAVEPDMSRLVVVRNHDFQGALMDVRVAVDGQTVAKLGTGESFSKLVTPGPHAITVDNWSSMGHYTVNVNSLPNATYLFEIGGRGDFITAGALGGIIGQSIDSAANENSGMFEIKQVWTKPNSEL